MSSTDGVAKSLTPIIAGIVAGIVGIMGFVAVIFGTKNEFK